MSWFKRRRLSLTPVPTDASEAELDRPIVLPPDDRRIFHRIPASERDPDGPQFEFLRNVNDIGVRVMTIVVRPRIDARVVIPCERDERVASLYSQPFVQVVLRGLLALADALEEARTQLLTAQKQARPDTTQPPQHASSTTRTPPLPDADIDPTDPGEYN